MSDNILVVDDNDKNRKLLRFILEKSDYQVIEAEDGAEGVKMALEHLPALILMDIQMPVMEGGIALKALQADERTRQIPVFAVTSYAMKGDRERFLEQGFQGYISKPIRMDDVLLTIKAALDRRRTG